MRKAISRIVKLVKRIDIRDAHVYGGIALITFGVAHIYWPAAPVVAGSILLALALRRP